MFLIQKLQARYKREFFEDVDSKEDTSSSKDEDASKTEEEASKTEETNAEKQEYHSWTVPDLTETFPNLALVIDLTATYRYYDAMRLPKEIRHVKIMTGGQVLPNSDVVQR